MNRLFENLEYLLVRDIDSSIVFSVTKVPSNLTEQIKETSYIRYKRLRYQTIISGIARARILNGVTDKELRKVVQDLYSRGVSILPRQLIINNEFIDFPNLIDVTGLSETGVRKIVSGVDKSHYFVFTASLVAKDLMKVSLYDIERFREEILDVNSVMNTLWSESVKIHREVL
jgi:hypothetical protein